MRYAIVSDIHANLAAWKTVLTDITDMKADNIICLGDVVGYGPNPVEVLESVYRVVQHTLMGNHDAAVCGIINPDTFSPRAKAAVLRHRELLSQAGIEWLKTLPLIFNTDGFCCAHGDFSNPATFRYIIDPEEALPSWKATREQLLFVGHSHLPGIYVIGTSGNPHFVPPCDFELEAGKRYIVNPGTVGYPRVGDCRSSYCLYDDVTHAITFRQLPFDCDGFNSALKNMGMDNDPWLLNSEAQRRLPWLRERLSFGKPSSDAQHAQELREHARLDLHRKRRTPHLALLAFAVCAALAAGGYAVHVRRNSARTPLAVTVPDFDLSSLNAYPLIPPDKNLLTGWPASLDADGRIEGWRYAFEDRTRQRFSTVLRDGSLALRMHNSGPCRVQLESPLINLAGTQLQALRLRGRLYKSDTFSGTVFYQVATYDTLPNGALALGSTHSYEVRGSRRGKATRSVAALNRKIEIGTRVSHIRFRIEAAFDGTLEIENPLLTAEPRKPTPGKEPST